MKPLTEQHLAIFRRHMVEMIDVHFDLSGQELGKDVVSPLLRQALLDVPRHLFVPPQLMALAYQDTPLPIGFDKTLSQPFMSAVMIELLDLSQGTHVLEVGTGLGYQAALMAQMGAKVRSVEIVEEFAEAARLRLSALGYDVEVRDGDGTRGWPEHAPFEAILITAAAGSPPQSLLDQLKPGGRMVLPIGDKDTQQLTLVEKKLHGGTLKRAVMPVTFSLLETRTGQS
jgi:protein-L-isoaspartate(D-aspartate) O-methyltransferase